MMFHQRTAVTWWKIDEELSFAVFEGVDYLSTSENAVCAADTFEVERMGGGNNKKKTDSQ
jgi:hypothetical protein